MSGGLNLGIEISEVGQSAKEINSQNISEVFTRSMDIRHLMKLLGDTQSSSLPLQYKYLSLYKIFELEFRFGKKWTGLREALAPYDQEYRALNVSGRALVNLIHDLRDKCAVLAQNSELPRSLRFWRHCRTVARMITILSTVISILAFQFRRRTLGVGVTKACDHRRGAPFIRSSSCRAESRSYNPRFLFILRDTTRVACYRSLLKNIFCVGIRGG
jgi:hypothetical protein